MEITTKNAKLVKELYLRNLSAEESAYIKALQVRFQKKRSTEAASLALFGYFKLEAKYEEEKRANLELRNELRDANTELKLLKSKIKTYFQSEAGLLSSKDAFVQAI